MDRPKYMFQSMVIAKNREIKLGEEYIAEAFLSVFEENKPYKIILCDIKNNEVVRTKDTLPYDSYHEVSIYKTTPKDTGTFHWGGIIQRKQNDLIREYPFTVEYHVRN